MGWFLGLFGFGWILDGFTVLGTEAVLSKNEALPDRLREPVFAASTGKMSG